MSDLFSETRAAEPTLLPVTEEPLPEVDEFLLYQQTLEAGPGAPDLVVAEVPPSPIGRGWAYDFQRRRFIPSPTGHGPLTTHGDATLRVWVEKALRTARGAHSIYSDDFGIDLPGDDFGGPVEEWPIDTFEQRVRDALVVNDNITDVTDFAASVDPNSEAVAVDFTIVKVGGEVESFQNVQVAI